MWFLFAILEVTGRVKPSFPSCGCVMSPSFHWLRGVSSCIRAIFSTVTVSPEKYVFLCNECCSRRLVKYSFCHCSQKFCVIFRWYFTRSDKSWDDACGMYSESSESFAISGKVKRHCPHGKWDGVMGWPSLISVYVKVSGWLLSVASTSASMVCNSIKIQRIVSDSFFKSSFD